MELSDLMPHRATRFALSYLLAAVLGAWSLAPGAAVAGGPGPTRPGGGHWSVQSSGTGQPLFDVACFDALRCKAVGAGGTILDTQNGGKTWRFQSNPLRGTPTILYRIACVGQNTCYVVGRPNVMLVTHDGGASWSVHRIPLPGTSGALTDAACVSSQARAIRGRPALCRIGLLDVACVNVSTCLVVATHRVPLSVEGELGVVGPAVFLTADGGSTWTAQSIPTTARCQGDCTPANARVRYPLEWVSCGPGPLCRAGGSIFVGSHPGYGTLVIKSQHPGMPWVPLKHAPANGSSSPAPDSAVCPTETLCFGVWTTSPFSPGNKIWRSTDGGWTWQAMGSGTSKLRNAIACPAAGTCYSVGNQGTITASSNGRFLTQASHTSHDLYGVTCVAVQTCIAVGNKGTVVARSAAALSARNAVSWERGPGLIDAPRESARSG